MSQKEEETKQSSEEKFSTLTLSQDIPQRVLTIYAAFKINSTH